MDSFRVFSFYLCLWIVNTAIIEDLEIRSPNGKCGTVTMKGPTVSGRDIKVEFLPPTIKPDFSASINCQRSTPEFINMAKNGSIYTYTLKRNTNVSIRHCFVRYFVNQHRYCDTYYFEVQKLLTLEGCGLLYMYKRDPILVGDTVELRYMPADAILNSSNSYNRKWILRRLNGNQTEDIKIDNINITEEQAYFNNETVLKIRNITMAMSGGISLRCTEKRSENKTTDEIQIQVIDNPIFIEPPTATYSDVKCPEAAANDGHGKLIGAVVTVLAVAVIINVIACVYWKRKKQRQEKNAVNIARTDNDPIHPDTNNDDLGDAGVIVHCSSAKKENEYANVIPKCQRPQRQQEQTIPLAAENDFESAVVNNKGNCSEEPTQSETESDYTKLKLDLLTPGAIYTSLKHD